MLFKPPPGPRPRPWRAAVEQPRFGIRQLTGISPADPEREQRRAVPSPVGPHHRADEVGQFSANAVAVTVVPQDRIVDFAGQQLARLVGAREFDPETLPP